MEGKVAVSKSCSVYQMVNVTESLDPVLTGKQTDNICRFILRNFLLVSTVWVDQRCLWRRALALKPLPIIKQTSTIISSIWWFDSSFHLKAT